MHPMPTRLRPLVATLAAVAALAALVPAGASAADPTLSVTGGSIPVVEVVLAPGADGSGVVTVSGNGTWSMALDAGTGVTDAACAPTPERTAAVTSGGIRTLVLCPPSTVPAGDTVPGAVVPASGVVTVTPAL